MYLYKKNSACRYTALTKFVQVVQKWLGMNKFLRTKSHRESKFSQISLGQSYNLRDCSCAFYIVVFHCGVRWCHRRAQNSEPHFWSFFTSLRKDSVANYASIWTLFSTADRRLDLFYNELNVS